MLIGHVIDCAGDPNSNGVADQGLTPDAVVVVKGVEDETTAGVGTVGSSGLPVVEEYFHLRDIPVLCCISLSFSPVPVLQLVAGQHSPRGCRPRRRLRILLLQP